MRKGRDKKGSTNRNGGKKILIAINEEGDKAPRRVIRVPKIRGSRFNALNDEMGGLMENEISMKNNNVGSKTANQEEKDINRSSIDKMAMNNSILGNNKEDAGRSRKGRTTVEDLVNSLNNMRITKGRKEAQNSNKVDNINSKIEKTCQENKNTISSKTIVQS